LIDGHGFTAAKMKSEFANIKKASAGKGKTSNWRKAKAKVQNVAAMSTIDDCKNDA